MRTRRSLSWLWLPLGAALALAACGDDGSSTPDAGMPPDASMAPDAGADASPPVAATLVGRAILPAATFADGPASGTRLGTESINGQTVPFDRQPVQGFSGIADGGDGTFLALSDNGYGSMENSADFHLRVYRIRPDLETESGGSGEIAVESFVELRDPGSLIPFTITNQLTAERILTGADLDVESIQVAPDGTWWIGDEFGPFLLHFDDQGVLLDPPFPLPDFDAAEPGPEIRSPQNPSMEEASAVRVMNAARAHALAHGNTKVPVFSPYNVMLKYEGADPNAHYGRGDNTPAGLAEAASDVFDIASIQAAGYPIVTWTVNDKARMDELLAQGVNGIISDRPDLLYDALSGFDADGDGTPGDYLAPDGLIDGTRFDAQGHRGARHLRPENTLPAMEAALDNLMGTLETDTGISSDGIPVLSHDPYIDAPRCRRADGVDYTPVLIKDVTVAELQSTFICDGVFFGDPQTNDPALSPASVAFAADRSLASPYVMPTLEQLFDFVDFYVAYYRTGAGAAHPDAAKRATNAEQVRYNIETKLNPRSDTDGNGNVYKERTIGPEVFADNVASVIINRGLAERADIQSFDFRTLVHVQETQPAIRTVYLFGDFPIFEGEGSDDGTNLQDEAGANTPWLAGLRWPYRVTARTHPVRLGRSGGFEGMALSAEGTKLLPLLEKPLDGTGAELLIHEFDIATKKFTGVRYRYPLASADHAIGDFIMVDDTTGLVIERDDSQGDVNGFKTIQRITLKADGELVDKAPLIDLTSLEDPHDLGRGQTGDVGVGGATFAFPFQTIESVIVLGDNRLGVVNDNNYPFSVGRHVGSGAPDDTELVIIELAAPIVPGL